MADEKKQSGLFSWMKKNKTAGTPSADNGSKQQAAAAEAAPKPAPPATPAAPVKSETAPALRPKPAPAANQEKNDKTDTVDTEAAIRNYFESIANLGVNHLKMAETILNAVSESLEKLTGNQNRNKQ
ncbi:MAG: hypothetical protein K4305_10170 [Chlorobium sp.]|uniref:hypothetical protein n=1 Tax=Chlorobium sp. TaxID=1095 RepID=UPI002F42C167